MHSFRSAWQGATGRHCALATGALLCLCTVAVSADEKADTSAIKAVYATHSKGFRNKDAKTMFSVFTADCKVNDHGHNYPIPQLIGMFGQQAARIRSIKEYREDLSAFHFHGKKATVSVHVTFTGKAIDPHNIIRDIVQTGDSEDTLIKTASGAWKIQHSDLKEFHLVVDGRPVAPTPH